MDIGTIAIYALCEPGDPLVVRYVGQTARGLAVRLDDHLKEARGRRRHTHREAWLRALLAAGIVPAIVQIDAAATRDEANAKERAAIARHRAAGCRLVNHTDGGEVGKGADDATRAKMRAAHLGRKASPETRAKMAASQRVAQRGRQITEEHRARLSAALKGRTLTPEQRANQIASYSRPDVVERLRNRPPGNRFVRKDAVTS